MEFPHDDNRVLHDRRRNPPVWHLEKTISIGHIITTVTVAASLMVWGMEMNTRVSVLEVEAANGQKADARIEQELRESVDKIEAAVIRIESSLKDKADKDARR